jgi:8-oxo-dGTP diphosphatase
MIKKQIEVVAAVIKKGNTYLVAQRGQKGELAYKWEFPGGKVEPDETHEDALVRELQEEFGVTARVVQPLITVFHEYDTFLIKLHAYVALHISGEFAPAEHIDFKFMTKNEMMQYDFAAADLPIIKVLK